MKDLHLAKHSQSACLACGQGHLGDPLFSIKDLPLVDSFLGSKSDAVGVPTSSVVLRSCNKCSTVQIDNPVDPTLLYSNYIYDSSSSPDLDQHFEEYVDALLPLFDVSSRVEALEIGCNDGLLASKLVDTFVAHLTGVDPSPQANDIDHKNIKVVNTYFGSSQAETVLKDEKYDLIVANNVLSHIPNMNTLLSTIRDLLSPDGVFVFEVQSLYHLLNNVVFDYIYHEHIFYHSISSIRKLLELCGLSLFDISFHPVKGGTYRFFVSHPNKKSPSESLKYAEFQESLVDLGSPDTWKRLTSYLDFLRPQVGILFQNKNNVLAYGASATATVLQRYFNIESSIKAIIDDNPKRQGLYSPGFGLPIISLQSAQDAFDIDLIFILAWRHLQYISPRISNIPYFAPLPYPIKN